MFPITQFIPIVLNGRDTWFLVLKLLTLNATDL